jgi:NADH-quinone oxidoreductase subunit L
MARLAFLFALSPVASAVAAIVGACTALLGAIACARAYDLRRVLAHSSTSQLGLAFVAFGAHAYTAGVFQLATHAVAKTCLLLATASTVQAMRTLEKRPLDAHDLRHMGGLAAVLPRSARAYRMGCLALTMVPIPLFAGFWSTGQVLDRTFFTLAFAGPLAKGVYGLVVAAMALTSLGMWRSYHLAFEGGKRDVRALGKGEPKGSRLHSLSILGFACALFGLLFGLAPRWVGADGDPLLESWLAPAFSTAAGHFSQASTESRCAVIGLGLVCAFGGWAVARNWYGGRRPVDWVSKEASRLMYRLGASPR